MATRSESYAPTKPRSDAYVGLLVVSLLAMIAAGVFLYLDWSSYPPNPPPKIAAGPKPGARPPAPAGGPAQPPAPVPAPAPAPGPENKGGDKGGAPKPPDKP
jgi:hypothetical protein